ncbi:MAG: ATP-binding protein [Deltaproteobacteria bacterium]|nr:ATP-binding protein [Deltaproteobacteria bacterium]
MFRTNRPATADLFFDRRAELQRLEAFIAQLEAGEPAWLAIIGQRKVGKTSLILELARRSSPKLSFVLADTQGSAPLSLEFFRSLALRVVDTLLAGDLPMSLELAAVTGDDYLSMLESAPSFSTLSAALRRTLRRLPEAEMDAAFAAACLDLPEQLAHALDVRLVIAIDEFQELASLAAKRHGIDPLPIVRSVWQRHERIAYIVSGSGRSMLEDMVSRKHSPFFQHFEIMRLDRFSEADAIDLLVTAAPAARSISVELAGRAVAAIGTHPFYLQLLGQELVIHEPPYDEQTLKAAVQALLFSRTGRLSLYLQNEFDRLVGRSTYLAAVLAAVAEGPLRLTEIARRIKTRSGDTSRYLERLADAIVRTPEGLYALDDPTFGLWLSWRRPGGTVLPMRILGDHAELETAVALSGMGFDLVYQSRGSRGSFDLLATRGAFQLGVQVKRSATTLRFSKAEWNRMSQDAHELDWRWVIARVSPEGEVTFYDPVKASKRKLVTLQPRAAIENLRAWCHSQR